jgi:hypothetical protein
MKKLIAISVVFALIAGVAFAVDVTGTVFGHFNVLEGSTAEDSKVTSSGGMDRVRIDGSGEAGDGAFGGYIRLDMGDIDSANAWWKPIDQFKLIIGNNTDGFWGKEGVTGWGFNQMPNDSGIATNYGIWYGWDDGAGGFGASDVYTGRALPPLHNRYTFFEGVVNNAAMMEITPMDMLGINIAIPFEAPNAVSKESADVFKAAVAQINLNLDFGNIAITYDGGGRGSKAVDAAGAIYAYFGGTFGDLGIDFGVSYHLSGDAADGQTEDALPIGIGVGVKYATDSFGVKFRTTAALAGKENKQAGGDGGNVYINTSVLPYFNISDSLAAFANVGLGMVMPEEGDNEMGWYFNPYLRVGAEWGPTFYAGVRVESPFKMGADKAIINWSVPVSLMVSF